MQLGGYHVIASRNIKKDELLFENEESAVNIVSKEYVEKNWDE